MPHLLVTNDFPPKIGGIQSYLHELWRRLPPGDTTVLTTAHPDSAAWDAAQPFRIERSSGGFLAPTPALIRRIDELADDVGADIVLLDPLWPLGAIGPRLQRPFGVVLHGAEVTVPARLPFVQLLLRSTLRKASLVIAAGGYPEAQGRIAAGRDLAAAVVPPGVDAARFRPLDPTQRAAARHRFGVADDAVVVLGLSRLVARKGFDVLIEAAAQLHVDHPDLKVLIAGEGRDRGRLEKLAAALDAPVRLIGRIEDDELPALYGCADVFAMLCRDRWAGLEQEGFGIVFLEAAAAGVPAVAGASGGSAEAVVDGETGVVLDDPGSVEDAVAALRSLIVDPGRRARLGAAARERALRRFSYDALAVDLGAAIDVAATAAAERRAEGEVEVAMDAGPGNARADGGNGHDAGVIDLWANDAGAGAGDDPRPSTPDQQAGPQAIEESGHAGVAGERSASLFEFDPPTQPRSAR